MQKFFILSLVFFLAGCAASKQSKRLEIHQNALQKVATSQVPTEEKIDVLMTSFARLMNEGLEFVDPRKGVAYVKRYGQQNTAHIDLILEEVSEWQQELNTVEKIAFVAGMLQKPYTQEFFQILPKFEQRYRQVKFVMDLSGKVKKGLGNLAGKSLGL